MDNLTHGLVGALIGQAGLKRRTGLAMPALIIGANLPDVDAACFFWLDGVEHLGFRRGITHGPIAWVLLPLVLAGLLYGFDRWQERRGKRPGKRLPVRFGWLYALSFLACLTHPALDWLNVYGIRLLEPFSSEWFYGDVLFIIDVWLWVGLGFGTWFSLRREKRGGEWRKPARIGLATGSLYILFNLVYSRAAPDMFWGDAQLELGSSSGDAYAGFIVSPPPIAFWRRELIYGGLNSWMHVPSDVELHYTEARPISDTSCKWPFGNTQTEKGEKVGAFLFWSRAPLAERAPDGSVILRDARYYDSRARARFSVALPTVQCEERPQGEGFR